MTDEHANGDLSPMLSQSDSTDNAPMISGRGTKIIADARGAYVTGNAAALIARLDAHQHQAFRHATMALGCAYAERAFRLLHPDAPEHRYLTSVRTWLSKPTEDRDNTLLEDLVIDEIIFLNGLWRDNQISGYSSDSPAGDVLARLALTLSASTLTGIASFSTEAVIQACWMNIRGAAPYRWHYRQVSPRYKRQFKWVAQRYHLEAAWALLRGQTPPLISDLPDPQQGADRIPDLSRMLEQMNQRQQLAFRQIVIEQGLHAIERYMTWGREFPIQWMVLDTVRDWLADPSEENAQKAMQRIGAVAYGSEARVQAIRNKVRALIDAIRAENEISAAIFAMEPFVPYVDRSAHAFEWPDPLDAVQSWQIQVAWSLLHEIEPPRLWPEPTEVSR